MTAPRGPLDPVWSEYDRVAEWAAKTSPSLHYDHWPVSSAVKEEIIYDPEAFAARVRGYAHAMERPTKEPTMIKFSTTLVGVEDPATMNLTFFGEAGKVIIEVNRGYGPALRAEVSPASFAKMSAFLTSDTP